MPESRGPTERLTTGQVAASLRVSASFVRELVARGDLKAYRLGRKTIRIAPADLSAYLQTRRL